MNRVAASAVRDALRAGARTLAELCLACPDLRRPDVSRTLNRMVVSGAVVAAEAEYRMAGWAANESGYLAAAQDRRGAYRGQPSVQQKLQAADVLRVGAVLRGWKA